MRFPTQRSLPLALAGILACSGAGASADHLVATVQDASAGKQITLHEPDGNIVFSYSPSGGPTENTPNFLESVPSQQRFLVTCTDGSASTGGSVEIFDYSAYGTGGAITHVMSLDVGDKPFHTSITPDERVCVAIDGETPGRILLFDLMDPANYESIVAGQNHATTAFVPLAGGGFDIYASNFFGPSTDGSVDIVEHDGSTWIVRADDVPLGAALPHTAVFSTYNDRVYYSTRGQLVGFDTQGAGKDQIVHTIPTVSGNMTPLLNMTPDGRYLVGGLHYDGAAGSYFYKVDLLDDSVQTVPSVSCKYYAFSPDGAWIVAGDLNKDPAQANNEVHVIDVGTMTREQEWELTGADASNVGFQAAAFSPDSRFAYMGLPAADAVMVVDTSDLSSYTTFPTAAAPKWVRTLSVTTTASSVSDWQTYQ